MTYTEFAALVRKLNAPRVHKITNSYGVYDAYKWIRKNGWLNIGRNLTELQFYYIIRNVNKRLARLLSSGYEIKLPHRMGVLEVRKRPSRVAIKDGKLVTNLPIDWDATIKLWYEDEEAYNNKTLVRREVSEKYSINYDKSTSNYNNKSFFLFFPNRELTRVLCKNADSGKIDAFLYYG